MVNWPNFRITKVNIVNKAPAIPANVGAMVWMAECFNTALEQAVDLASPDIHPLARRAKDAAAAAVLVAAIFSLIVGLIIFLPSLLNKISV